MKRLSWIGLMALAVLPYLGAVSSPLLYDDRTLLDNAWLAHDAGPVSVFRHDYWFGTKHEHSDLYRPLTVLSLAWNVRAAPTKEGIRAVNILLHALATLAVWQVLRGISNRPGGAASRERTESPAWIGAALFAVHPLGSEAVLWAVGRAEILAAIMGSLSFLAFVRLDDREGIGGRRLVLSLASFLAALCFKESAASWLVIGAAWIALLPADRGAPAGVLVARAACFLAVLGVFFGLRATAVGWRHVPPPFVDNPLVRLDAATRGVNGVLLLARYVAKMVWPWTLSVEYGFDQLPVVPLAPWGGIAAAAVLAGGVVAVVRLRRAGHVAAGFLVAFVPCAFIVTGNVLFPIGTVFAERLAYLPLAGFCGLLGLALAAIPGRAWRVASAALLITLGGARTVARGRDYRDVAALSEATAAASPRAVKALANAARVRLRQNRADQAVPLLDDAVAIWPDYARGWELLADALAATGDTARAEDAKRRAAEAASRAPMSAEPL
jgi:hypothetical protein